MLAAARVGGIHANSTYPTDFIYEGPGTISVGSGQEQVGDGEESVWVRGKD